MIGEAGRAQGWRAGVEALLGLGALVLALFAVVQVALRYLFSTALVWVEEVSVLILIWMVWGGVAYLWAERRHIAIDFAAQWAGPGLRRLLAILIDLTAVAVGTGLAAVTPQSIAASAGIEIVSLEIDITVKYYPVLAGAVLLAVAGVAGLWQTLSGRGAGNGQ